MTSSVPAYLAAFAVAVALVPVVTVLALRWGATSTPRSDRWNVRPVPILGGLAIAGGALAGFLLLPGRTTDLLALLAGMAVMLALGLIDDLGYVPPLRRLIVEATAAAAFTFLVTAQLDWPIRVAAIVVATACVPVAINAVNLVDNADGLATLLSIITAGTLAAIVAAVGIPSDAGAIALVIGAACLGFLVHNLPPARVFMGDSGSLMLGFGLAACSVLIVRDATLLPGATHAAAAMAVPLAWALQFGDLGMVFITRLRRRASPFRGDVDHTSHRLISAGVGPVGMLIALSAVAALVGAAAVALAAWVGDFRLVAIAVTALAIAVAAFEAIVAWRLPYGHRRTAAADEPTARSGEGNVRAPVASKASLGRRNP